jgi:hypothetical protein
VLKGRGGAVIGKRTSIFDFKKLFEASSLEEGSALELAAAGLPTKD